MYGNQILLGDSVEVLRGLPDASIDSVVADPPYGLAFMGKKWDYDVPSEELWRECLRVLKPGGHLLSFSGTRTYHRMVVRIEDAGFEIRDQLAWVYGSGFPKSLDVSKAIDKAAGAEREKVRLDASQVGNFKGRADTRPFIEAAKERGYHEIDSSEPATPEAQQWQGWGTALKPAWEPICLARKPLAEKNIAANVLAHGTGAINVDGCRIETVEDTRRNSAGGDNGLTGSSTFKIRKRRADEMPRQEGRFPANLLHDGSDEVLAGFPETGKMGAPTDERGKGGIWSDGDGTPCGPQYGDSGSAARFFYCAKANKKDREDGNDHPTVKPTALMQWLCRLVTPPGGVVLDPFMGSGSTGKAAVREGFRFVGIEREEKYHAIAVQRIANEVNRTGADLL